MSAPRFHAVINLNGSCSIDQDFHVLVEDLGSVGSVENTAAAERLVADAGWRPRFGDAHHWLESALGFVSSEVTR